MYRLQLRLLLSLALLFAGCIAARQPTADSGLEGQVWAGPTCPVVKAGADCPDQPYAATLTILDLNRAQVAQTQADQAGHFKIALAPGTYILHPEPANALSQAPEQAFNVSAGLFTSIMVTYDSGLR